jgi:hypothetical protein
MSGLRLGLLPFDELDDQQFEAFVLHMLGAQISLTVVEEKETREGPISEAVRHKIVRVSRYGPPGPGGQRGIDLLAVTETGAQWAFQCKHYSSPFTPAMAKKAVAKAEAEFSKAQRYFLVVSGEPTPAVRDVAATKPRWEVWSGSQLSIHFFNEVPRAKQIEILQRLFPSESGRIIPRLFPQHDDFLQSPEAFFALWLEPHRLFHHRSILVGQEQVLAELDQFVNDAVAEVCVLAAAGGMGKTRILRAFSEGFAQRHPGKTLYFVDPNARASVSSEHLRAGKPGELVVIQDDAHRRETLRADLVATLHELGGKLILSTRPQAVESLKAWLGQTGINYAHIRELPAVKHLTRGQLIELASRLAPKASPQMVERVVDMGRRNVLIITVGAGLVGRGELPPEAFVSSEVFRDEVFRRFEDERFAAFADGVDELVVKRVLRVLAVLAPWNDREVNLETAAMLAECSPRLFQDAVERLRAAELIAQTRHGWRVVPDLFADYLVFRACYDPSGKLTDFAQRLQEKLAAAATGTLLRNLAEAEWQANIDERQAESLLAPFWNSVLKKFAEGNFFDRADTIRQWTPFSVLQPGRSLTLARQAVALTTAAPPPKWMERFDEEHGQQAVLDLVPALLEPIAIYDEQFRTAALNLLWELFIRAGKGDGKTSSDPLAVVGHVATFHPRRPGTAPRAVVEWLAGKLATHKAALLCDQPSPALAVILKPIFEHEAEDNLADGLTLQLRILPISVKNTRPLRARALEILEQQVIPRGEIATINALGVLQAAIEMVRPRYGSQIDDRILAEWLPERRAALAVIARLITPQQSPRVLYRIRTLLRNPVDYDCQPEFKAACAELLSSIPDSFELRLTRVLLSNAWSEFYRVKDDDGTSTQDRLKTGEEEWERFSSDVAKEVSSAHPGGAELLSWLEEILEAHRKSGQMPQPHSLVLQIARQRPELAAECLDLLLAKPSSPLDSTWASWFAGGRKLPDTRVEGWLEKVFSQNNADRWRNALGMLRWVGVGELTPGVLAAVAPWAGRLRDRDFAETIESLRWHGERERVLEEIILRNLQLEPLSDDSLNKLADALGRGLSDGTSAALPIEFERKFLAELPRMKSLSDHRAEGFLGHLAKRYPREFFEILFGRVKTAETKRPPRFEPLPFGGRFSLDTLPQTEGYDALARDLFERYLCASPQSQFSWKRLLHMAVMEVSPLGVEMVRERLPQAADEETLVRLIQALHFDGSNVIFAMPDLIRLVLQKIEAVVPGKIAELHFELAHTASPTVRSYEGTNIGPEAKFYREQAAKAAAVHGDDGVLGPFYREIVRSEDAGEKRHREWVEMDLAEWL